MNAPPQPTERETAGSDGKKPLLEGKKCGKCAYHQPSVNPPPRFLICLLLVVQGLAGVSAQQPPPSVGPKEEPPRKVRLLAIGDAPPHREEIVDDVRIHLPPPPGTIPPRVLGFWLSPETRLELRPQLGRWTTPLELPAGMNRVPLVEGESGPDGRPWLTLELPAAGDHLAILTRGGTNPSWNTPSVVLLPDDARSFPAGRIVLLNLAAVELPVQLGTENLALPARGTVSRDPGPVESLALKAARVDERGRAVFFHQGEILLHPGERALVILYPADGVQRRQPLKLLVLKERAPTPPLPPGP